MLKQIIRIATALSLCQSLPLASAADSYTYEVRVHDISPPVTLSGTVIPKKEATFTAQIPGRVEIIAGEEGAQFEQDALLVALDDRELLAKRRAAYAEWMRADAALRNAGMQYSRELWSSDSPDKAPGGMGLPHLFDQFFTKPLSDFLGQSDEGLDRRAQLHSYGSQIEQARSTLLRAESEIEQIDAKLRDAESRAPFDGVITKKLVEVGDTVMMGQPLLQFAEMDRLQIEVDVPARLVRSLKVDKQVSAKLDVLDERIVVTVAQIFPIADPQRHTVKVKFDIPTEIHDKFSYVGPGQYAQVDVPEVKTGQQELLLIPKSAVDQQGSLPEVCIFNNNQYKRRVVRLGTEIDPALISELDPNLGDYISVLSGLKEGDQVVINPVSGKTSCGGEASP